MFHCTTLLKLFKARSLVLDFSCPNISTRFYNFGKVFSQAENSKFPMCLASYPHYRFIPLD